LTRETQVLPTDFGQNPFVNCQRARAKANQNRFLDRLVSIQKIFRLAHGNPRRPVHRKTIRAGADGWERHGLDAVPDDERETTPITTREQFILAVLAVVPDRADGVNDPSGREFVAFGDFGLARDAAAECAAFRQQFRPGRPMDGAIHAAAAQQGRVGRIHNRLHAPLRDVTGDDGDAMGNGIVGFGVQLRNRKMANADSMLLN